MEVSLDSDSTKRINTDDQKVKEIAHWLVLTAIHHPMLLALKGKLESDLARNEDVIKLEELGCDKSQLLNVLAFANAMPSLYPPLEANTLRELAKELRSVFQRMKAITPSSALPWSKENADGRQFLTWVPTGGDLHIWPDLEGEVQRRADMYSELARLCAQRKALMCRAFPPESFMLYRGDDPIQDRSTKKCPVFGLGSSFGEPQCRRPGHCLRRARRPPLEVYPPIIFRPAFTYDAMAGCGLRRSRSEALAF